MRLPAARPPIGPPPRFRFDRLPVGVSDYLKHRLERLQLFYLPFPSIKFVPFTLRTLFSAAHPLPVSLGLDSITTHSAPRNFYLFLSRADSRNVRFLSFDYTRESSLIHNYLNWSSLRGTRGFLCSERFLRRPPRSPGIFSITSSYLARTLPRAFCTVFLPAPGHPFLLLR